MCLLNIEVLLVQFNRTNFDLESWGKLFSFELFSNRNRRKLGAIMIVLSGTLNLPACFVQYIITNIRSSFVTLDTFELIVTERCLGSFFVCLLSTKHALFHWISVLMLKRPVRCIHQTFEMTVHSGYLLSFVYLLYWIAVRICASGEDCTRRIIASSLFFHSSLIYHHTSRLW